MRGRRERDAERGHAISAAEVAAFGDGDAEVVMLAAEGVGEEVGKGFRVFSLQVGEARDG